MQASVNVLLFGDNAPLARRCLKSILRAHDRRYISHYRIGLNAVGAETKAIVREFMAGLKAEEIVCTAYWAKDDANVMKYPLMTYMLADTWHSQETHIAWFDDDSFIRPGTRDFWYHVAATIQREQPTVLGSVYTPKYTWSLTEILAIQQQPWYGGVDLTTQPRFATGGFWVADVAFLRKWGYPVRELKHNGGDVLLGEMCRQQGGKLYHYREGVAINADERGQESKAKRRGLSTLRPYQNPPPYDYSHLEFDLQVGGDV